jgi:hypothetical protein
MITFINLKYIFTLMKSFFHYTNSASKQAHCKRMNIPMILVATFLILFMLFTYTYFPNYIFAQATTASNNNNAIIKDPNKEVPSIVVNFEEKEVEMDPFIHSQSNPSNIIKSSQFNETQDKVVTKIGNANLFETQTDIDTKLNLKQGDKIMLSYEKQPLEIKAYLIDYDTEYETEIYPIKQIDFSTFSIPTDAPVGLKNLEIRCSFNNNEQVTYTTSVFVETNNPIENTQQVTEQNNEENNENENEE